MIHGWTDYPILELGDVSGSVAPIREAYLLAYDGDKYGKFIVQGMKTPISFKVGYFYQTKGRLDEAKNFPKEEIFTLHDNDSIDEEISKARIMAMDNQLDPDELSSSGFPNWVEMM